MADNEITFRFEDSSGGGTPQSSPTSVPSSPPPTMPNGGLGFVPTPTSSPTVSIPGGGPGAVPTSTPPPAVPGGGPGNSEMVGLLKNINNYLALGESRNAQKNEPELAEVAGAAEGGGIGAIAAMVAGAVKKVATAAPQAIGFGLDESKKIAQNRNFEVLGDVANKAADGLGKLSPALGEAAHVAVDLGRKFGETVDMFVDLGHKLAPLSGPLTEAEIKSEQRSLMGDVREANTLGPDLARLMDAQSRASDELRELILPIKQWIVQTLAGIMESIVDGIERIRVVADYTQATLDNLPELLTESAKNVFGDVEKVLAKIANQAEERSAQRRIEKSMTEDGLAIQQLWGLWNQIPGAGREANSKVLDILGGLRGANPGLVLPGDGGLMGGGAGGEF